LAISAFSLLSLNNQALTRDNLRFEWTMLKKLQISYYCVAENGKRETNSLSLHIAFLYNKFCYSNYDFCCTLVSVAWVTLH